MNIPLFPLLYSQVKKEADQLFLAKTSIYKSSWIVREYKKRGGTYEGTIDKNSGLQRWYREKWIDLNTGQACGRSKKEGPYPLCRPLVRITPQTPKTVAEIPQETIKRNLKLKKKIAEKGKVSFVQPKKVKKLKNTS